MVTNYLIESSYVLYSVFLQRDCPLVFRNPNKLDVHSICSFYFLLIKLLYKNLSHKEPFPNISLLLKHFSLKNLGTVGKTYRIFI